MAGREPCPFCKSADVQEDAIQSVIYCADCGAVGPFAATIEQGRERWDMRGNTPINQGEDHDEHPSDRRS